MENAVKKIAEVFFEILGPLILAFAGWLAHRGIKLFESKTKIDVPVKQEAQVDAWVVAGIAYAEEKVRNVIKANGRLTGPQKLESAVGFVFDLAQKNGWVEWTRDLLAAKIEAKLNTERTEE